LCPGFESLIRHQFLQRLPGPSTEQRRPPSHFHHGGVREWLPPGSFRPLAANAESGATTPVRSPDPSHHRLTPPAEARITEAGLDLGIFVDRSEAHRAALADLIDRYGDDVSARKRGVTQERFALRIPKRHFGPIAAARLSARDIAQFGHERLASGRSATTVREELSVVAHVINTAII
jgi:Arc/MetJ-type ribon-helix-helix transcriptional regulator